MNWRESCNSQFLEAVVADLKEKLAGEYYACNEDNCCRIHDDLVDAEWRLRKSRRRQ